MFELKDRETGEIVKIYSVKSDKDGTQFLIFAEENNEFVWVHSSYYLPLS